MTSSLQNPKVSVLIPTYKYARFLPEAIESVLRQSFADFELLVSDDASADGSAEIIERYAAQDSRIRCKIQPSNLGMVANWNACLREARGQYIKYVFGDDFLIERDAITRFVDMLESAPAARLAVSARTIVDEQSQPLEIWDHAGTQGLIDGPELISACLRGNRNLIGEPTAVMFRKADANREFDPAFKQVVDLEFWIYLIGDGKLAYTSTPLCAFRRHPQQQTEINRQTMNGQIEHRRLIQRYQHYFIRRREHKVDVFDRLYRLRKKKNLPPDELEFMKLLASMLGDSYHSYWLRHKLVQPFRKARHSWQKHVAPRLPEKSPAARSANDASVDGK
jgi:glycosyltransferase involved in cell wall biosynthesis